MENNNIIFVEGLYSNEVSDKAPDFILGSLSIQPMKLVNWIQANLKYQDSKGYIKLTVKRSKAGKRFIAVDTYQKGAPAPQKGTESQYQVEGPEQFDLDMLQNEQPAFDLPEFQ